MASELHTTHEETAEWPAPRHLHAAATSLRHTLAARLEGSRPGRALLGCLRWGVVFGLILSGYLGAGAINAGIESAQRSTSNPATSQPLLAASTPTAK